MYINVYIYINVSIYVHNNITSVQKYVDLRIRMFWFDEMLRDSTRTCFKQKIPMAKGYISTCFADSRQQLSLPT